MFTRRGKKKKEATNPRKALFTIHGKMDNNIDTHDGQQNLSQELATLRNRYDELWEARFRELEANRMDAYVHLNQHIEDFKCTTF